MIIIMIIVIAIGRRLVVIIIVGRIGWSYYEKVKGYWKGENCKVIGSLQITSEFEKFARSMNGSR